MHAARNALLCTLAGFSLLLAAALPAVACPFCSAPSLTLSEQVNQSDAVALVKWVDGKRGDADNAGETVYQIEEVLKGASDEVSKGDKVTLARYRAGKAGDLFLLMGTRGLVIQWGSPLEVTRDSYKYIAGLPDPKQATAKRLEYFVGYLEHPELLISNDAYAEFANAPYSDIEQIGEKMPREKLRKWIGSSETPVTRIGLYGLMFGLCGEQEDAELMRKKIAEPTDDFRLGIDGLMSGYLLLTGEKGLDLVDQLKLQPTVVVDEHGKPVLDKDGKERPLPFSETYSAMQALRFMQRYAADKISDERLKKSMRILLDRPELADLVIADLARWKDWTVQSRLIDLYGAEGYDIPSIKRAIVRYMLVSTKDVPEDPGCGSEPEHVTNGKKYLDELEKKDPRTVREAKRFFFLN